MLRYITKLTKLLIVVKFVINLEVHHTALLNDRYSIINCCFGFICQQMHVHVFSYISCTKKEKYHTEDLEKGNIFYLEFSLMLSIGQM